MKECYNKMLEGDTDAFETITELFWKNISSMIPIWERVFNDKISSVDYSIGGSIFHVILSSKQ